MEMLNEGAGSITPGNNVVSGHLNEILANAVDQYICRKILRRRADRILRNLGVLVLKVRVFDFAVEVGIELNIVRGSPQIKKAVR